MGRLKRPSGFEHGVYARTMKRMALFGALASVPFIALGGLGGNWWPLNVMFTLLVSTATLYLIERGSIDSLLCAGLLFLVGGAVVEYWWLAIVLGLAVWFYCKQPSWLAMLITLLAVAALWFINGNHWALAALPLLLIVYRLDLPIPRLRWVFYGYYPLHLAALWLIRIPMGKAGYLFF